MATQPQQLWDCCPPKTQLALLPISSLPLLPWPSSQSLLSSSTRSVVFFNSYPHCCIPSNMCSTFFYLLQKFCLLEYFFGDSDFFLCNLIEQVDDFAFQTKTVAGHNLDPTPWHPFPPKNFGEQTRQALAYKIIYCSYLSCHSGTNANNISEQRGSHRSEPNKCPDFFRWIHHDLEPWARNRISSAHLAGARKFAAFRVVIVGGKLYADFYYTCVQSRAMFTIWGLLQLLERYPGMVPDVDMMFDCMDKPRINTTEHRSMPLPLFRYCTNEDHYDIPFPDWSFWGW